MTHPSPLASSARLLPRLPGMLRRVFVVVFLLLWFVLGDGIRLRPVGSWCPCLQGPAPRPSSCFPGRQGVPVPVSVWLCVPCLGAGLGGGRGLGPAAARWALGSSEHFPFQASPWRKSSMQKGVSFSMSLFIVGCLEVGVHFSIEPVKYWSAISLKLDLYHEKILVIK